MPEITKGNSLPRFEPTGKMTLFNRRKFHQEILREEPPLCCNDEIWTLNTQDDIHGTDAHGQPTTQTGIQAMAAGGNHRPRRSAGLTRLAHETARGKQKGV